MPKSFAFPTLAIITICFASCAPLPLISNPTAPPAQPSIPVPTNNDLSSTDSPVIPEPLIDPISSPKISNANILNIRFNGLIYDSRSHNLKVIDQTKGPGTEFLGAKDLASKKQALLAINAGFFTPEGNPLGLVISEGQRFGSWNSSSSLGNGIYRIDVSGKSSISRRTSLSAVSNSKELLQAGPLLIENGKPLRGLEPTKIAMRSILLHDGGHRWWIGTTSPCSLAELSRVISAQSPAGWNISYALNLDGGRSTDLFISSKIPHGNIEYKSLLNRQVRNFLILQ